MVRRFVEHKQVGVGQQHIGQCHPLELSARKLSHRLVEVGDVQLRQYLFGAQFEVPGSSPFHFFHQRIQIVVAGRVDTLLVAADERGQFAGTAEAGVDDRLFGIECRCLFEYGHLCILAQHDGAFFVVLMARKDVEQRTLSGPVVGNEAHLLPFGNAETDVAEEFERTEALGEVLYVKQWSHFSEFRYGGCEITKSWKNSAKTLAGY